MDYVQNGESEFYSSTLIQDAVIRNLETIGEATGKLSDATKSSLDDIPWPRLVGMRNVLIHDYGVVDLEIV